MIRVFRGKSPNIHPSAFIAETASIFGDVEVEEDASIWFNAVVRGDVHSIRIGKRANVQDGSVLHVYEGWQPLIIGDEVTVGHMAVLHGCTIGRGSLVGIGATILDDAEVGEECVVGAGAVLGSGARVPARTMVVGVPAKVRRPLTDEEVEWLHLMWRSYMQLAREYKALTGGNGPIV